MLLNSYRRKWFILLQIKYQLSVTFHPIIMTHTPYIYLFYKTVAFISYEIRTSIKKLLFLKKIHKSYHLKRKNSIIFTVLGITSIFSIWQLGAHLTGNTHILPSPLKSFITLSELAINQNFWMHIGITLFRGIIGGILSLIFGFILGMISSSTPMIKSFLFPWIVLLRSIPVISVILLAIIWLAPGYVPFFIMLITVTPIVTEEVTEGVIDINQRYREMIFIYKVTWKKQLKDVLLPGLLPRLASGFSLGMGYGWRAVVVGEVLSRPQWGIGDRMAHSQNYFNADELIAWTVILIVISYLFDKVIERVKDHLIKWQ